MPKMLGIAYTQEGEGKDILLLHGWGSNKESFALLGRKLSASYRVTALDFNGFGESDACPRPYTVAAFADRVNFFTNLAGIKPYLLLGHSFGGRVAIKLCSEYPDFTEKLVLADSAGILPRRGLSYRARVAAYKTLKKLPFVDRERLAAKFGSSDYRSLDEVMRATFVNVVNEDLEPLLPLIRAETLVLWGEKDAETPLYMAERLKKGIPGAGLAVIEGAGHFSFIDRPQRFLRILQSFLETDGGNKPI